MDINSLPYRKAVQIVLVNENDEVLIIEVARHKGFWKIPSGGIEEDEEPIDALRREAYEELQIRDLEVIKDLPNSSKYKWGMTTVKLYDYKYQGQELHAFVCKVLSDINIVPDKTEIERYKWVKKEDLNKYFKIPDQLESAYKVLE